LIVIDASAVLEVVLRTRLASAIEGRLFSTDEPLHAPHVIDLEVAQVLRRYVRSGAISSAEGQLALDDWLALPVARHRHDLLLPRIWDLTTSIGAYDAAYVVLAETLGAPLVTTDARLARAHGHDAKVEVFAG
jgi:predicted nucleic acid-binding protein